MSQAPSMPFFVDAYLADTGHLTADEHGAYLLLLFAMWRRNGEVPDDDKDNARVTRLSIAKWRKVKERLRPFLTFDNGQITQKRLKKEWDYVAEKRAKNAQNGARGGRPTSSENNDIEKANGSVSVSQPETQTKANPVPIPVPIPEVRKKDAPAVAAAPPSGPDLFDTRAVEERTECAQIIPLSSVKDEVITIAAECYNEAAEKVGWPQCTIPLTEKRRRALGARIREAGGLKGWLHAIKKGTQSRFLLGDNSRGWKPTGIDFFLQQSSFTKLMEGGYDNHDGAGVRRSKNDNLLAGAALAIASFGDDDEQRGPGEAGGDACGPRVALLSP